MHKKFKINRTKMKGGCPSGRKVVTQNSKSNLSLNLKNSGKLAPRHSLKTLKMFLETCRQFKKKTYNK